MNKKKKSGAANTLHKLLVSGSGAAGGFWGLPSLPVKLPVSTAIMIRSIVDIARSEAQPISEPRKSLREKSSAVIIKLISHISSRFCIQVSEKIAAQAIPVIGAAGGAFVNTLFIDHFQSMARGHFIVLRLEKNMVPMQYNRHT